MKTINSLRSKLLALTIALMASVSSFAYDFQVDGLNYTITSSVASYTVEVTKNMSDNGNNYEGYTSITIPKSVLHNGVKYQVTGIGKEAFLHTSVSEFTIPETVKYIAESAFCGSIELTSIEIPNSVTDIGSSAFTYSHKLTSVTLGKGVTTIGSLAFLGCRELQSINIPASVTTISALAFYDCPKIKDITLSNSLIEIRDQAFAYTNITSIELPQSVTILGINPFSYIRSLTKLSVKEGHPLFNSDPNSNAIIETATNTLVAGCRYSIVPNTITVVGKAAFMGCKGRTELSLPNSVKTINDSAYFDCIDLKSIDIPNSVTTIGSEAFGWCTSATSLTIGENVNSIGGRAFWECGKIKTVTCKAILVPNLGEDVFPFWFGGNINNATLYVPAESIDAYKNADQWKDFGQILPIEPTSYKSQWCDTWNVFVENGSVYPPHEETYRYQLAKDTVIGDYTYTAIVSKAINDALDAPHYVAAVRFTDDRKVYIYYDNAEYLLYDFNVQEGDELEVFAGINNYTSEIKTYKCTVTGVEQYACMGCPATITLQVHNHPNDFREFYRETQWIEGVGDINGFLNGINGYINIPGNAAEYLLCAYQGDELKYTGPLYEEYGCGDDAEQTPEDLFPTLWGLQRTSCTKTIGEDEYGTVWGSRSYLMQETQTTTIDGKQYLLFGTNNIYDEYCSLWLREENNKILVYSTAQEKDLVLYDFTLNVGDSLSRLYVDYELSSVVDYGNWGFSPLVVTEVSTITLLDGKEYKKWTFDNGMQYVEGIGSFGTCYAHNDFYQLIANAPLSSDVYSQHLVCVSKNGQLLYQMDDTEMERLGAECLCEYNDGPKKDNAKDGKIGGRPTPTQWNMLEMVVREMENNKTILQAETFSYTLEDNSRILNNKTYFDLARQSTRDTAITKSVVGALHFGENEDNRVYFLCDGMEYLLYDFTAEPGDSIEIFAGINNYPQATTYTHIVTSKDTLENGACRMVLEVVFPNQTGGTNLQKVWLAGLGSLDGIVHNSAQLASNARSAETESSVMLCAWREDDCLYTTDHPEFDKVGCVYNLPTAVDDIQTPETQYQKIIHNGHLYILRNNKIYDVLGTPLTNH